MSEQTGDSSSNRCLTGAEEGQAGLVCERDAHSASTEWAEAATSWALTLQRLMLSAKASRTGSVMQSAPHSDWRRTSQDEPWCGRRNEGWCDAGVC